MFPVERGGFTVVVDAPPSVSFVVGLYGPGRPGGGRAVVVPVKYLGYQSLEMSGLGSN